jgi:hypothetical protein
MDENHEPKRLWSFIKSKRTDWCVVAPLRRDGIAYSDARMKANTLNNQFTSLFTSEDPLQPLTDMGPSPHPAVSDITITQEGVHKLLCHLNPIVLKETAKQISPALTLVFQASINQGKLPEEWKSANITPLFKKGDRSALVDYRPVSLTSVCSKVTEHTIQSYHQTHGQTRIIS